ncbi:MAG: universal stress protein [Stenotrophomonas sp.]
MYTRILIATDGSDLSAKGLSKGLELAAQLGAAVDIVTVSEPWAVGMYDAMGWSVGYETSPEYKKDREDAAQKILQPAVDTARAAGIANVTPHHVLDRYAADGIIETAESCGCDLIVMTSHGRRGVTRVLLGSQTTEVLVRSKLPVLVIR